ncbi:MAG: ComF family protein [Planctomycetaceae bacterium]|nr:ComF family protein [Planctomycetaceae bacterium]
MRPLLATFRDTCVRFGQDVTNFVYLRNCVHCRIGLPPAGDRFLSDERDVVPDCFCPDCYELLSCTVERACLRCGAPVGPYIDTSEGCRHCRKDRFHFDRVFALGVYEGPLRACCTRVKQPFEEPLTAGLTELLADAHREEWINLGIDLVIPIPHHWTERVMTPHLPPQTMSRVFSRRLMAPETVHILCKTRRTPAQSSLTPSRRRKNLRNAFRISGGARLDGLTVLLTDDILTTGTTADRAAQVLVQAGAKRVIVAVIARGIGH